MISVNFSKLTLFMAQKLTFRRQSISSAKNASLKTLENNRFVNLLPIHKPELHKNPKSARAAFAARRRVDLKSENLDVKEKCQFSEPFIADIA